MKVLNLHVDYINFKPLKKAVKDIGELSEDEKKEKSVEEALAALVAIEKGDEKVDELVEELKSSIENVAGQLNVENVVVYPYSHLSQNLGSPDVAQKVLKNVQEKLQGEGYNVERAPFGYYKQFELKVKGHPLSELSKNIKVKGEEKTSREELDNLIKRMEKFSMGSQKPPGGQKNHIQLGQEMDIFTVNEVVGHGLPLFTPRGTTMRREIERFIVDEELRRGYEHTSTPEMASSDLFKVSGHWDHYKEDMFTMEVGNKDFALRPMTCPFQYLLYKRKQRSYKDLPKKYAEIATLFRGEKSGELRGLTRVRQLTLSDAHIICRPDQLQAEFEKVLDLLNYIMDKLGVGDIWYRFSKWDPAKKGDKYIDDEQAWEKTQTAMKQILDQLGLEYVEAEDEAAFYGPKLDLQYKDVFGKEDTLITVQIDFNSAERFNMEYKDENNEMQRPMIIHRSSAGTTERMISYILEKTQGHLPTWLAPEQVRVLNFTDRNFNYANEIVAKIKEKIPHARVETDYSSRRVQAKVKEAENLKVPYVLVAGDKEQEENAVSVRKAGKVEKQNVDEFVESLKSEIENRE
ncbi:MAG: threonine--tRNA ligase [Candidatus Pacearchaeota archaeon]